MTRTTDAQNRLSTLTYDPQGFLASLTDPLSRTVQFTYDAVGRVTTQTLPDGRVITSTYDANGNVTSITPPSRPAHTFSYSPLDLDPHYHRLHLRPGRQNGSVANHVGRISPTGFTPKMLPSGDVC